VARDVRTASMISWISLEGGARGYAPTAVGAQGEEGTRGAESAQRECREGVARAQRVWSVRGEGQRVWLLRGEGHSVSGY